MCNTIPTQHGYCITALLKNQAGLFAPFFRRCPLLRKGECEYNAKKKRKR
nr:MAG TPA: hypothetical protein [Caudoviricetes sp.]